MVRDSRFEDVAAFHGHVCPGLVIGYRAALAAIATLDADRASDEELVAIVENDSCAVDAVQYVTGCTFGKGNLVFLDYGKQVLTLALRPGRQAVRVALRAHRPSEPKGMDRAARVDWLLKAPVDEIFDVRALTISLPERARIQQSVCCDACGEGVMATRVVSKNGRNLCIPCSQEGAR